ncbi:hypothetical protein, partial [Endozoicomonas numazuensis]|uniref:hypothetical protein n=1 Tax=Endozoicomonas numazuensis TaxID=1137799 RepID=UPI0005505333
LESDEKDSQDDKSHELPVNEAVNTQVSPDLSPGNDDPNDHSDTEGSNSHQNSLTDESSPPPPPVGDSLSGHPQAGNQGESKEVSSDSSRKKKGKGRGPEGRVHTPGSGNKGNNGGKRRGQQNQSKEKKKQELQSFRETSSDLSLAAGLALVANRQCCNGNGNGPGKASGWFRKGLSDAADFVKKNGKKLSEFLFRKRKRPVNNRPLIGKKITAARSAGRISNSPLRSLVKVVIGAGMLAAGGGLTVWYWKAMDDTKTKENDDLDSRNEPNVEPPVVDMQCKGQGINRDSSLACESLRKKSNHRAAELIMQSAVLLGRDQAYPVFSVFHQSDTHLDIYRKVLPVEQEGLVYGMVGYLDWPGLKVKHQPYFRMEDGVFKGLLERLSVQLTKHFTEGQLEQASSSGLDALSQTLLWCGVPLGKPARKIHGHCVNWVFERMSDSPTWYMDDIHRAYYQQQVSRNIHPQDRSYLGFSPLYHLDAVDSDRFMRYENRKLEDSSKEQVFKSSSVTQLSVNSDGVIPDETGSYDVHIYDDKQQWHKVLSAVEPGQPVRFIPGRIYGISHKEEASSKRYLVSNGQQLLAWREPENIPLATVSEKMVAPKKWLFVRQGGLNPVADVELEDWHYITEYPKLSGAVTFSFYHILYQLFFSRIVSSSPATQAAAGGIISFMAMFQWQVVRNHYSRVSDDPALNRYLKLSDLLAHYQKNRELNKFNMLLALSLNQSSPLGLVEYREKEGVLKAQSYKPLTTFDLRTKIKTFNQSYVACQRQFKGCNADHQEHVEFLRFHMAICGKGIFDGCGQIWQDPSIKRSWLGLMYSVDWKEETMSLMPETERGRFTISPSIEPLQENYQFSVAYHAEPNFWTGSDRLFEVEGRFRCHAASLEKEIIHDDVVHCRMIGNKTYLDFNGNAYLLLFPEFDSSWGRIHWLSFIGGQLLTPTWQRQAQWQMQHVKALSGTLDNPEQVARLTQNALSVRPGDSTEESSGESSGESTSYPEFLFNEQGFHTGSDLEFCNQFRLDNLRLACIAYPLTPTTKQYFLQLADYAKNKRWLSLFNVYPDKVEPDTRHLSVVERWPFSALSADRLIWHIEFLKDYPELGTQPAVNALIAYAGVVKEGENEVGVDIYRRLYRIMQEHNVAERFKHNMAAQCYMRRLFEGKWCAHKKHCLSQLPSWRLESASVHLKTEVKVANEEKLYRTAPRRYNDRYVRVSLNTAVNTLVVDAEKMDDIEFLKSGTPIQRTEGQPDTFDVSVESVPLLLEDKEKGETIALFMLQKGHLYQGSCDRVSLTLLKDQ